MHHFTIRDVENMSGIKAHTLRMWEQRYGLNVCKRKESKHRYYDNEDLKNILRVAYLYHNGYRISRIAKLSMEEIRLQASQTFNNDEYEVLVNQLVESGLLYNQPLFEKSLHTSIKTMGLEKSIERVIYPFLDKIGLLWLTNHVLPAQEHFCSHLIQKSIMYAINGLPPVKENNGPRVLLFTPKGEMHDLPLLFAQYVMKKKGIKTVMMGSNCTTELLKYCCEHQPVTHLYFSFITNFTNGNTGDYITKLAAAFPNLQIIGTGAALRDVEATPANVRVLRSVQEVINLDLHSADAGSNIIS
jgi:DNA-binding transcriptional MerR regulator